MKHPFMGKYVSFINIFDASQRENFCRQGTHFAPLGERHYAKGSLLLGHLEVDFELRKAPHKKSITLWNVCQKQWFHMQNWWWIWENYGWFDGKPWLVSNKIAMKPSSLWGFFWGTYQQQNCYLGVSRIFRDPSNSSIYSQFEQKTMTIWPLDFAVAYLQTNQNIIWVMRSWLRSLFFHQRFEGTSI